MQGQTTGVILTSRTELASHNQIPTTTTIAITIIDELSSIVLPKKTLCVEIHPVTNKFERALVYNKVYLMILKIFIKKSSLRHKINNRYT